jgi:hypothetical protein
MAMMWQESKFVANARPPHRYALGVIPMGRASSAYGYSQALDGTWEEYVAERGRARRDDIADAADFMGWYMADSAEMLGLPLWDVENHYLAYHEGRSGYARQSHLEKGWLLRVAADLEGRAAMYDSQLAACGVA